MTKTQSCLKDFIQYASLNVLGMIGLSCYILADTFFISKGLGANGLAALNLAIPVYSVINGTGLMLGMGGATKYAIFKGQRSAGNADCVFTNVVYVAAVLSAVFVILGAFGSGQIAALVGADAQTFEMTNTYLKVILLFSPAFIFNQVFVCFVRNDGRPRLSMLAMLMGSLSNIVMDYILIFPLHLGILGAVLATGCAPLISMAILSSHRIKKEHGFHFRMERVQPAMIASGISLGFPSLITELSSGIVILVFNAIVWKLEGNIGIAAYGVIANLSIVAVSIFTGIAQGMQPIVSRAYGEGDSDRAKQIFRYGVMASLALSAVIYLTVFVFAEPITAAFNSERNGRLQEIAVYGNRVYFTAMFFMGVNIVISSYFTSVEKAVPAHVVSLLRGLILVVPAAYVLSAWMGMTGVWLAVPVAECAVCMLGITMYARMGRGVYTFNDMEPDELIDKEKDEKEMSLRNLKNEIAEILRIKAADLPLHVNHIVLDSVQEDGYIRQLITYGSCGDQVTAYLLLPEKLDHNPAILINHQHNREHHLGKSEVCGLAGNPLQAFGAALAKKGFVVLAPDALCFEERRKNPCVEGFDFWQHFDEVCYRIINGNYMMKKVLEDAMNGITLLSGLPYINCKEIGTLGHSMGGNTVLFLSALDDRISFSCASGSACTYANRMENNVGIEMASVIPDFHGKYDIYDLVSCAAPRKMLIVSAEDDKYSKDASYIIEKATPAYEKWDAMHNLCHKRFQGGHALTQERFDYIVEWIIQNADCCS